MFSLITGALATGYRQAGAAAKKFLPGELADNDDIELAWPRADFQGGISVIDWPATNGIRAG